MWSSKQNRIIIFASAFILLSLFVYAFTRDHSETISLHQLQQLISDDAVKKVIMTPEYLYIRSGSESYRIATQQVNPQLIAAFPIEVAASTSPVTLLLIVLLLFAAAGGAYAFWKLRRTPEGESAPKPTGTHGAPERTQSIAPVKSNVSFKDIGGIGDVKMELDEIIDFLKNPKRYRNFGARMPRGVLLVGPPGVGKTMIAKAVATEAEAPFFYQSGASFVQIYVGMGAKRVQELFRAAKANAPAIIFIDEIDAVGKKRDGGRNDEREGTLNQLLTEMDGFEDTSGLIVIAATNNIDVLDSALLRAGRFDRRIFVELPTPKEREAIFSKYLTHVPNAVDVEALARMTVGFNGASLAAMVNEAALLALRQNDMQVEMIHFEAVKDKVLLGKKKIPVLTDEQKAFKAFYEAGKSCVAYHYDIPFEKATLNSETIHPTASAPILQHEFEACVRVLLAGMAACEIRFGERAAHGAEDLASAKDLIDQMITRYGMGRTLLADGVAKEELFEKLYSETVGLLKTKENTIRSIADVLLEYENISRESVAKIVDDLL
jgi:cell division protease FtsH